MIELRSDRLMVSFSEIHPAAKCSVDFQRTLRVPDDNQEYPLPAGLGRFPVRAVDDFDVPGAWKPHGGVFVPMYASEALWINFSASGYPFAVKVAAGKIDALTGEAWNERLQKEPQDYAVLPRQPWLDGFSVAKGVVRQFVAMPLGEGVTAEEQITGAAEWGGVQMIFYPMKAEAYERYLETRTRSRAATLTGMALGRWRPCRHGPPDGPGPGRTHPPGNRQGPLRAGRLGYLGIFALLHPPARRRGLPADHRQRSAASADHGWSIRQGRRALVRPLPRTRGRDAARQPEAGRTRRLGRRPAEERPAVLRQQADRW